VLPRTGAAAAAALSVILAGAVVSAVHAGTSRHARGGVGRKEMPSLDARIATTINAARAASGLPRLRVSGSLRTAADAHSNEMLRDGYFSHASADGSSARTRLAHYYPSAGYRRWHAGEVLLWYSPGVDAATAVRDWLASPEHRVILLSPAYREIGVSAVHASAAAGSFHGDEITLVTADFGGRTR
jgi:uncharacterized protein YkwD